MSVHHKTTGDKPARRWAGATAAFVLFLAGIGFGWFFTDSDFDPIEASDPDEIETVLAAPETSTTILPEVSTAPLVPGGVAEPVADVAEAVLPSVVQINVGDARTGGGLGTGVIFDDSGLILTAQHVVDGYSEVVVKLSDGTGYRGVVLGGDSNNDIAVIDIDAEGLAAAPLALDAKPRPGSLAVALGSPWGLDSTVTSGIVSAVDRALPDDAGSWRAMLQTDASINPGNSGGPLIDREGRVIGINVSIFSQSGANDGVGFAVPIDRAYRVAEAIVAGRDFIPGYLGVTLAPPDGITAGAVVIEIGPATAAEGVGIIPGDIVLQVNDVQIADLTDLAAQVRGYEPGDIIELTIIRDDLTEVIAVELGSKP